MQYPLFVAGLLLLALTGYVGYVLYPRFDLSAATGVSLLALAALAGVASLFSPCSFPLLMTLLAREAGSDNDRSPTRPLRFSAAFAAGAVLFLLLSGAAIAFGAAPLFARVTFTSSAGRILRTLVGAVLIGFGLWQVQAPPHDETGHTWHHNNAYLIESIVSGGARLPADAGVSPMPAYENVLSETEIGAVVAYLQSTWPPEILAQQARR